MSVINTNYLSLVAQSNLNKSESSLDSAIERLSSGLKINSAADNAAGQAISNRMTAQVTGMQQASDNANDGISLAQTAEGNLDEINTNLQRIRALTVQAENGTNSASDLQSIQEEITQRLAEIDRISSTAAFNGTKILSKDQSMQIQVGANDGEVIDMNLQQMDTGTLGISGFSVLGGVSVSSGAVASGDLATDTGLSGATAVNVSGTGTDKLLDTILGGTGAASGAASGATASIESSGVYEGSDGNLYAKVSIDATKANTASGAVVSALAKQGVKLTGGKGNFYISLAGTTATADTTKPTQADYVVDATKLTASDLVTGSGTNKTANPLTVIDKALQQVDSQRSNLGALENRFDSVVSNLDNTVNNLSSARSRIQDADYSTEVSNMTRAQILQQAGTAVLAQANKVPQTALSLLQ